MTSSSFPVVLSSINQLASNPNTFRYVFPLTLPLVNKAIALVSAQLYYSWFNITAALGNNQFSFTWIDGTVVNVTIPDGFYTVDTLNAFLEYTMSGNNASATTNKYYLINASGQNVFYLQFITNSTYYAVEIDSIPVPSALPTSWTLPPSPGWSLPASATNPQVTIPVAAATASFSLSQFFGINAGTYPSVRTLGTYYQKLSDYTPEVTPVSAVQIAASCCLNMSTNNPTTLWVFPPTGSFGSIINVNPNQFLYVKINQTTVPYIDISFLDQNGLPLPLRDPYVTILVHIRDAAGNL
jgi:hypothetical protein